jgi:hypothetical protein
MLTMWVHQARQPHASAPPQMHVGNMVADTLAQETVNVQFGQASECCQRVQALLTQTIAVVVHHKALDLRDASKLCKVVVWHVSYELQLKLREHVQRSKGLQVCVSCELVLHPSASTCVAPVAMHLWR